MNYDVVIIGAGAAGFMCAIEAGKRGRSVLLLDHAKKPAEKIRISGGGRCNFTNLHTSPSNYISQNPHFCKSALSQYTQHDFIALIEKHHIAYHEKKLGQLFCNHSSQEIIDMLLEEARQSEVKLQLGTTIHNVEKHAKDSFKITSNKGIYYSKSLVIATGGKSIPKMGATDFGYRIAHQFGLNLIEDQAALVPFIFEGSMLKKAQSLAGLALPVTASCNKTSFNEAMLFTHRGVSGPAVLQISSYWKRGDEVTINLAPDHHIHVLLAEEKAKNATQKPLAIIAKIIPKRLAMLICAPYDTKLAELSSQKITALADAVHQWRFIPNDTEGYRTAEVSLGGVDTQMLSAKTFECRQVKNLYFIGEVVDVTGHLGGFNFQWAWASGYAAGQYV